MERSQVLTLCGSLRAGSFHAELIAEVERHCSGLDFTGEGLAGRLPLFNPDIEQDEAALPEPAADFRRLASRAHGIVIASPEYARGPSGVTKNAVDWLVGCGGLSERPTLLLSASPGPAGGLMGQQALLTTLGFLGSVLVATVSVPRAAARFDQASGRFDTEVQSQVKAATAEFRRAVTYARHRTQVTAPG